jgi:hypothetical protein
VQASDAELYDALAQAQLCDGLPVIRPTHAALESFVAAGGTSGAELVGSVLDRQASAEAVALCAILAGCVPGHIPVLHACVRALSDPGLNARGVLTTTGSAALAIIVNGPLRQRLGFNSKGNCLGPGVRSNATVGRALSLITRFIGGAIPGVTDMSTMGQPGKYTFCFAENEEDSPWEPLHLERGFSSNESTVTLIGVAGTVEVVDVHAESATEMLGIMAETMAAPSSLWLGDEGLVGGGQPLVLISPEWARVFEDRKLTKQEVKRRLYERATCTLDRLPASFVQELVRGRRARMEPLRTPLRVAADAQDILVVVAGGIGVKQTYVPNWNGSSRAVTVAVQDR